MIQIAATAALKAGHENSPAQGAGLFQ